MNSPISIRQLCVLSVASVGVFTGYRALGQRPGQDRITFTIDAQLISHGGESRPPRELGEQSVSFRFADYTPSSTQSKVLPVMQRSAGAGYADDSASNSYIYIAGGGGRDLLLERASDGRSWNLAKSTLGGNAGGSLSGAFSDYDHTGNKSLFVAGVGGVRLYHNDGGNSFTEVTRKAGLGSAPGIVCTSAVLGDLDGDGFPDLLVTAYTDLNHPPAKSVFTFPNDFRGVSSRLYRNNGNGTFTEITEASGLAGNPGRARKAIVADVNSDRRLDILLLRDDKPPALYLNRGGWKFEDVTWDAGDDLTAYAFFEAVVADLNQDGKPDLALWSTHIFRILINQGNATFEQLKLEGMPDPAVSLFGFRGLIVDLDGDGFDDVVTVDGDGRLRAFLNRSGGFRPASMEMPQAFSQSYLTPIRLHGAQKFLAFSLDGNVALLDVSRPRLER